MIYEQAGSQEFIEQHRKPHSVSFEAGGVKWSLAGAMRMSEIYAQLPVPVVEISIKRPGSSSHRFERPARSGEG